MVYTTEEVLEILDSVFGDTLIEIRRRTKPLNENYTIIGGSTMIEMTGARLMYQNLKNRLETQTKK